MASVLSKKQSLHGFAEHQNQMTESQTHKKEDGGQQQEHKECNKNEAPQAKSRREEEVPEQEYVLSDMKIADLPDHKDKDALKTFFLNAMRRRYGSKPSPPACSSSSALISSPLSSSFSSSNWNLVDVRDVELTECSGYGGSQTYIARVRRQEKKRSHRHPQEEEVEVEKGSVVKRDIRAEDCGCTTTTTDDNTTDTTTCTEKIIISTVSPSSSGENRTDHQEDDAHATTESHIHAIATTMIASATSSSSHQQHQQHHHEQHHHDDGLYTGMYIFHVRPTPNRHNSTLGCFMHRMWMASGVLRGGRRGGVNPIALSS